MNIVVRSQLAWCWRLLLVLLCLARPAAAQPGWLRQFGPAEGLRQPFVYALAQDAQGYLWLGTAEGLVRYDGTAFVTFTKKDGLRDDFVTHLYANLHTGQLWAGHYQGGWSLRQSPGSRFAAASAGPAVPGLATGTGVPAPDTAAIARYLRRYRLRLPANVVPICLLEDHDGNAWLGTAGQGLWRHSDRYLRLDPPSAKPQAPAANAPLPRDVRITARASTATGQWLGTAADGLYVVPTAAGQAMHHFSTANGLLHNSISALFADRDGRVWVGTHDTGLSVWDPRTGQFAHEQPIRTGLDVSCFAEDSKGTLWLGTEGQGLYARRPGGHWQRYDAATGLPNSYTYSIVALPATTPPALLLTHRQGLTLLRAAPGAATFTPLAAADNPLVRELLPGASLNAAGTVATVPSRTGTLVVDLQAAQAAVARPPGLALASAEVDGEPRPLAALGTLSATRHRLSFVLQGISLRPGGGPLQYQYRLRGLDEAWSRPGPATEAQFPGLDAGHYVLEARARSGPDGPWSALATVAFSIATPFWRRAWFVALLLLSAVGLMLGLVRWREGRLRRQQWVLERTVRERTTELRQQKAHIEEINADLVVARDAAEASRQAKAQFLANMSHEIRTPMNAVIGLTNLLQATHPSTEQGEYLTAIESSSQNLLVIINDILDSSKMEAGKLTLEKVPFRLPEAIRRLEPMFRFATESKGLYLRMAVADDVPAAVLGDSVRLNQVLVNLVGNAIKFTRAGGVTLTAEVLPSPIHSATQPLIRFKVRDTGIGIPADKLGAIFEDFSQANTSTTREFGGTGLGLSIARNLVQLHGGQLGVTSEEGQGSAFFFDITYEVADVATAQPEAHSGHLQPFEPALRVLVAEDNALNQLVARKTLEAWNVQVVIAENGRLAVEFATATAAPFDAVLMDVQMPEMDGYEATRRLRQHFPDAQRLPIIGLTASVLPEDRQLALSAGMNDTLAKPFEPAVLYARLAHFTGRRSQGERPGKHKGLNGNANNGKLPPPTLLPSHPPGLNPKPDWTLLDELAGGNQAFLTQIVGTFLTEAPALEELLRSSLPHDQELLARTAHKLKGQVAYFGLPRLHAQLDELERTARQPGCPHCQPLVATISEQLAALYPQLTERMVA